MNASKLIEELKKLPQDAEVFHVWDGASRTRIECVWLSIDGRIMTSDFEEVVYWGEDRPSSAPTEKEDSFWETPSRP